ncbi:MAG: alternative ribosome rescue aminoacyl-tRNA hydrolase ArfB [Pseudomonadota bacterium]
MIEIGPNLALDENELTITFIRSPGAGGQNVNKVATAAQLRFDAANSQSLPDYLRARVLDLAGNRATRAGQIVITAHRFRTQEANRRDAIARLVALIRQAAVRRRPRIATRPTGAAIRKRLDSKKRRSGVKQTRGRVMRDDS